MIGISNWHMESGYYLLLKNVDNCSVVYPSSVYKSGETSIIYSLTICTILCKL